MWTRYRRLYGHVTMPKERAKRRTRQHEQQRQSILRSKKGGRKALTERERESIDLLASRNYMSTSVVIRRGWFNGGGMATTPTRSIITPASPSILINRIWHHKLYYCQEDLMDLR